MANRRRIRSLDHYEARVEARNKVRAHLEPRVVKRVRQVTELKLYKFGQLLELSKTDETLKGPVERVREWFRKFDVHLDYTLEMWGSALKDIGFGNGKIAFTGFCSQGDGASFTSDEVDIGRLFDFMSSGTQASTSVGTTADGTETFWAWVVQQLGWQQISCSTKYSRVKKLAAAGNVTARVYRDTSRYSHENTCNTCMEVVHGNRKGTRCETLVTEFRNEVEDLRRALSRAIYRSLNEEYDYQMSDESFVEQNEANDWWFTKAGEPYDD